jgi:hypothetical protein
VSLELAVGSAALGANCLFGTGCGTALVLYARNFGYYVSANLTSVVRVERMISLSYVNLAAALICCGMLGLVLFPYDLFRLVVVLVDLAASSTASSANACFYTVTCCASVT